jgi:competence protein ComGD
MTRQAAFTLIESVIVLGLICVVVSFGSIKLTAMTQADREKQFWRQLDQNWQASKVRAENNQQETEIKHLNGVIRFRWIENYRSQYSDVTIPSTIQVVQFKKLKMLANGYVKAGTQKFYSTRTKRNYEMKIQLAWGNYYVETT